MIDKEYKARDLQYYEDLDHVLRFDVIEGLTCPICNLGEVVRPLQTFNLTVTYRCIMCGYYNTERRFRL